MKLYIEQRPKLKLEQRLVISQVQIQILLSPVDELDVMLEKEVDENIFLEVYRDQGYEAEKDESYQENSEEKSSYDERLVSLESMAEKEYYDDDVSYFSEYSEYPRASNDDNIASGHSEEGLFYESVVEQVFSHFEDEKKRMIALEIFHSIDQKGYLSREISEIVQSLRDLGLEISEEELEGVRKEFMSLEPLGMGSKDVSEYIYFILKKFIGDDEGIELSQDVISDIKNKHPEVFEFFEKVSVSGEDIRSAVLNKVSKDNEIITKIIDIIKDKEILPFPTFGVNLSEPFIYRRSPDLEVEVYDDEVYIYLNSPRIYVRDLRKEDWYKAEKIGEKMDETSKKIFQEKIKKAMEIERGVKMRNDILHKVSNCIFSYQIDFLKSGDKKDIKPLTLEKLSESCGISVSMISRAIRGKTVKTRFGIFELKEFLSHGVSGDDKKVSQKTILEEIKNLVSNEDKSNPLSDSEIARLVKQKFGIEISRRTIVKYRKKLGIANVEQRKSVYEKIFN